MSSICRRKKKRMPLFFCCSSSSRNQGTHQQWVGHWVSKGCTSKQEPCLPLKIYCRCNCRDKILLGTTLAVMGSAKKSLGFQAPKRHVMDPTWWTSFKLGLSRQEETWHSPCPKSNKEMKHDHDANPFIVWMCVFIVVERCPGTVLIQSILAGTNRSSIYLFHFSHIIEPYIPTSLKTSLERPSKKAPNCAWNPWKKKVLQEEMNEKTHGPNWYPFAPSVVFDTAPDKETAEINVTYALKVPSLKNTYSHASLRPTAVWWFVWCMLLEVCSSHMT